MTAPDRPAPSHPASPNHGPRRGGLTPRLVVIHYTAMADAASARARLCDPAAEVSAHWLIARDGTAEALVPEELRAWHAGAGEWGGASDVNSRSIGIELDHPGEGPFAEPQMAALERLLAGLLARWSIPPEGVIAHSDMAPGRKTDPGPRFDWRRLALSGLSVWPGIGSVTGAGGPSAPLLAVPASSPPEDISEQKMGRLGTDLGRFGYPVAAVPAADLLAAFRLRFRPGATGPADGIDGAIAAELAARWPQRDVDAGVARA
ncbi:N-acetylmuramoyl-L-alanine amidase [Frigidibacter oleivorans]|uniref:N-acetylmuramoyl-L-alanine amidase n=1 Tax=Frigidibacter oleivorans TaxID=2487129 RepID=UPI001F21CDE9|nr:N-acetylmuramoyl-L-alanine amidase [Frigidibacter oleivorans]